MPEKRTLRVSDLVTDVREGLTDTEMMEKYKLSPRGLKSAFQKMLESKALTAFEFSQWSSLFNTSQDLNDIRLFARDTLTFHLPIYDMEPPRTKGRVVNVSESGIAIGGIVAEVDEKRTFLIPVKGAPVVLEATCRWTREASDASGFLAGFDISRVPRGDWEKLEKQISDAVLKARSPHKDVPQPEPEPEPEPVIAPHPEEATEPEPVWAGEPAGVVTEIVPREEEAPRPEVSGPVSPPIVPPPADEGVQPSLELVRHYLDSREYPVLFTSSRPFLAYLMNPLSFAALNADARQEMLEKVREKNGIMISDLRKKARAFQMALENSALLGDS